MSTAYRACSFKPGQHRSEAWQAPRLHRMVHVKAAINPAEVHAIVVPADSHDVRLAALQVAVPHLGPDVHLTHTEIINPDLIDIIK